MKLLSQIQAAVRRLTQRDEADRELDAEISSYVDGLTDERIAAGMSPGEARRTALAEFGGTEQVKQAVRDSRMSAVIETVFQDIRLSLRGLRKSPAFTAVIVITLALGIGANTAIFSLVNAVLLQTIPVKHVKDLVVLHWSAHKFPENGGMSSFGDCVMQSASTGVGGCSLPFSFFQELERRKDVFQNVTAFAGPANVGVAGNGLASIAHVELVTADYFHTLGVSPAIGRTLRTEDNQKGAPAVAVLDYGYWQKAFGGAANVVGKTLEMNKTPVTIVGVADPRFTRLTPGKSQDMYLALTQEKALGIHWSGEEKDGGSWWLTVVGRLGPGEKRIRAEAAANVVFRNVLMSGAKPAWKAVADPTLEFIPAQEGLTGFRVQFGEPLRLLMGAVGVVLLIACANVAGLMLARSATREREMAVRLALGASRSRVMRQVLTESLLLSFAGALIGTFLAYEGARTLAALTAESLDQPVQINVQPDTRVLLFTVAAAVMTGVLFGLLPALRGARTRAALEFSRGSTQGASLATRKVRTSRFEIRNFLVVIQVALSIVMLIGGGVLLRTLDKLRNIDPGFDTRNVLMVWIDPVLVGYEKDRLQTLYDDLQRNLAALPGVLSTTYSSDALLDGSIWTNDVKIQGQTKRQTVETQMLSVGPNFFETMRMPLLRGRTLDAGDVRKGSPVAVVNQAFVRKFLEGRDPLGLSFGPEQSAATDAKTALPWMIVGVVRDAKYNSLRKEIEPTAYIPLSDGGATFELRTAANPSALADAVRKTVGALDSNLPVMRMQTQSQTVDRLLFTQRLVARLLGLFATLAMALACIGLYGLLSYEVTSRTREIGVRMALGAQRQEVFGLVLRRGLVMVLLGSATGVGAAMLTTRLLSNMLYGVKPLDPPTFVLVPVLLIGVGIVACSLPAWRAVHVDPVVALRYE